MTEHQHAHEDEANGDVSTPADDTGVGTEPPDGLQIPDDPAEAVPVLMERLMAAKAEAADNLDQWKRATAEFDNFRKRALRDQEALIGRATERVLSDLLPTLDSFDAALNHEAEGEREEKLLSGMRGTRTQLLTTLAAAGLEPVESVGVEFDPELHEAVQVGEGTGTMVVTAELRRGYLLNGRVLRPALVAVGYEGDGAQG
jgi:molecular chaperone GrpE